MEGEFIVVGKKGKPKKFNSNSKHNHVSSSNTDSSVKTKGFAYNVHTPSKKSQDLFEKKWEASLFAHLKQLFLIYFRIEVSQSKLFNSTMKIVNKFFETSSDLIDVVSYGIGNFLESKNSLYQLAFIVSIWKQMSLQKRGIMYLYDPILSKQEKIELTKLEFQLIDTNEEGKRKVERNTLFFMPHCGKALYNNVLWMNWNSNIHHLGFIGNSFQRYDELFTFESLERKLEGYYIQKVIPFMNETALQGDFPTPFVFNDTSFITFPKENVEKLEKEFFITTLKDLSDIKYGSDIISAKK